MALSDVGCLPAIRERRWSKTSFASKTSLVLSVASLAALASEIKALRYSALTDACLMAYTMKAWAETPSSLAALAAFTLISSDNLSDVVLMTTPHGVTKVTPTL